MCLLMILMHTSIRENKYYLKWYVVLVLSGLSANTFEKFWTVDCVMFEMNIQ